MQTIFKTAPVSNFAIFSNELVNTPMPFKAKEVLIYLLSKPKDWRVKVADIRSSLALTTHTIRRSLEWLQSAGYAGYVRLKSGHTIWKIFDKPQQETARSPRQMPQVVLPHVAKPSDIQIQIDHKEIKKPLPAEAAVTSPISAQITESIVVVDDNELIYPSQLTEPQKKAAKHIIKKVKEPALQQPVLFALAYAITSGTVKSAPAYLQGLVTRANNGTFEPVGAADVTKANKPIIPIWQGHKVAPPVDNTAFFQDLINRFGSKAAAAIPAGVKA